MFPSDMLDQIVANVVVMSFTHASRHPSDNPSVPSIGMAEALYDSK